MLRTRVQIKKQRSIRIAENIPVSAVVDDVGEEDADGDVELEQDVEPTANPGRRNLRQEQRNGLHGPIQYYVMLPSKKYTL
jgi:hypothetical protein